MFQQVLGSRSSHKMGRLDCSSLSFQEFPTVRFCLFDLNACQTSAQKDLNFSDEVLVKPPIHIIQCLFRTFNVEGFSDLRIREHGLKATDFIAFI